MYIPYEPLFSVLKAFSVIRLYNILLWSVLRYTANCDVIRQYGNYWTIPAQVKKRHEVIFSVLSGFSVHMGKYPFSASKLLYGQIMALYGILCRCAVCPIVSEYAVRLSGIVSGCPAVQYRRKLCQPTYQTTVILCKPLGSPGKFLGMVDLLVSVRIRQEIRHRKIAL